MLLPARERRVRRGLRKRTVTGLLADPTPPLPVRAYLMHSTDIDITHELITDSEDALQLTALLETVAHSTSFQVVDAAALKLYSLICEPLHRSKTASVYYCPEIVEALEDRSASDIAGNGPEGVKRALQALRLQKRGQPAGASSCSAKPGLGSAQCAPTWKQRIGS